MSLILLLVGLAQALEHSTLSAAVKTEFARLEQLRIADQPNVYWASIRITDGEYRAAYANLGA